MYIVVYSLQLIIRDMSLNIYYIIYRIFYVQKIYSNNLSCRHNPGFPGGILKTLSHIFKRPFFETGVHRVHTCMYTLFCQDRCSGLVQSIFFLQQFLQFVQSTFPVTNVVKINRTLCGLQQTPNAPPQMTQLFKMFHFLNQI